MKPKKPGDGTEKAKRQKAVERKFWRYFLLIKTVSLVVIFALLAIAVWRFLRVLQGR